MLVQFIHTPVQEHACPTPGCATPFEMTHVIDREPKQYTVDENGEGGPKEGGSPWNA